MPWPQYGNDFRLSPSFVLHAGAHKTGTTLIQNTLKSHRLKLAIHGVRYISRERVAKTLALGDGAGAAAMQFPSSWRRGRWWPRIVLLSHERLMGRFQDFYADSARRANLLLASCQGHNAQVIIYVKRQDHFIESCYVQTLQMGSCKTFREFLAAHPNLQTPLWTTVVRPFCDAFGPDKVTVVPAETISHGAQEFLNRFLSLVHPSLGSLQLPPTKRSNVSLSPVACRIAQFANPLLDRAERAQLRSFLQHNLHSSQKVRRAAFFTAVERHKLLSECERDNRKLFERYMPTFSPMLYCP